MSLDPTQPVTDAEKAIAARNAIRMGTQQEFRGPMALELIADELTRLHAEVKTLRYLFATFAARPPGR